MKEENERARCAAELVVTVGSDVDLKKKKIGTTAS